MTDALMTRLRGFARDCRGLSAVEFALIAPVMILLYLGAVDLSLALSIDRKVTSAASALADLVAQDDVVTDDEMVDILNAGAVILAPFDPVPLQMRISSVMMDSDGDVEVQWSDARGRSPYSEGDSVTVPSGVLQPNRSIVMVEVAYQHETLFNELGMARFNLNEAFYLRPRRSIVVSRE
jgi:Flp pilus assembly protein TadG